MCTLLSEALEKIISLETFMNSYESEGGGRSEAMNGSD